MSLAVSLGRLCGPKTRGALISALAAIALIGCGGGGGGGGDSLASCIDPNGDEDLNAAFSARVITPDGPNLTGQINYPSDQDWFRFRGIEGIFYTLQIEGFSPAPGVCTSLDLTGNGLDLLAAQIVTFDGATQLLNSTGSDGGTPYDVDPAGVESVGIGAVGDSRIVWACPFTNDYFIRIAHRRPTTSVGSYNVRVATSQIMTIFTGEPRLQTGARFVSLVDDEGVLLWDDWVTGGIQAREFEFFESLGTIFITDFLVFTDKRVLLPDAEDFEPLAMHLHNGYPNVQSPASSSNLTEGDPPHPILLDIAVTDELRSDSTAPRGRVVSIEEAILTLEGGQAARIPVMVEQEPVESEFGANATRVQISMNLQDAIVEPDSRGGTVDTLTPEILRTFFGWPWYADLHVQPDLDLDPGPVAVSLPMMDLYQFFESRLEATSLNVVAREGEPIDTSRGLGVGFNIFYDAALKTFQVADSQYVVQSNGSLPPFFSFTTPDYAQFGLVGARVRVHEGGPGQTGDVIIDLGTLPPVTFNDAFDIFLAEPGFKAPIRQLTDAEVQVLRDAFYTTGFYVQVYNPFTNAPIARAEGFLEISTFPTAEPCMFPPCNVRDDNSPGVLDRGTVNFATTRDDAGDITVWVNGEIIGLLNKSVSGNDLPACGLVGDGTTVATELWPENYYWHALAEDGTTWDGFVNITTDGCETILLE